MRAFTEEGHGLGSSGRNPGERCEAQTRVAKMEVGEVVESGDNRQLPVKGPNL
jgi:hypothetical protein